ncbi:MAG TPA: hypothetical protein DCR46_06170 [Cytophagales bacterium]|nr:hypothetical protein [Cytophagales bacterium]
MKILFRYATLLFVSATVMLSSCNKKSDDPTPTSDTPTTPSGSDICVGNNTVKIIMDASTDATQNSYNGKSYACTATAGQKVNLILDVKSKKDMDYIFIKKVTDGGTPAEFKNLPDLKTEDGAKDVKGAGTDASYEVPSGDFINSALVVKIPLDVIAANSADVYTIWITKSATLGGNIGNFDNTGSKTVVGPIYVTITNGTASGLLSSQSVITLGDQANNVYPSYVTTSGSVNTLSGTSLIASDATSEEKASSLNAVAFNFVSLNSDGTARGDYSTRYFISVGLRKSIGFLGKNEEGTALTTFAKVTSLTKAFADITPSDISNLPTPSAGATKIKVESDSKYVFVTQDGRKGIIYTSNLSAVTGTQVKVDVEVKVLAQ